MTNTVSACCKCPVFVEGDVTTYWVCKKCAKACDIATTNSPTETVSVCPKCGKEMIKKWIAPKQADVISHYPTFPLIDKCEHCGYGIGWNETPTNPPTEPTVEKWDNKRDDSIEQLWYEQGIFDDDTEPILDDLLASLKQEEKGNHEK